MILCNGLKSLQRICGKTVSLNTLNHLLLNNTIRLFATEKNAVIQIRRLGQARRTKYDLGSWVLLTIPVSAFGLGVWQIFRKFEKDEIIKKLMEKTRQPTVELPENLEKLKDLEFCSVKIKGKFDHSKEIYMGPRPLIDDYSLSKPLSLISNSKGGYLVITPFKLSDRNLTILVNRGWVPNKKKSPNNRPEGQISEEIELVGLVRNEEFRKPFGGKNSPEKKQWCYRDLKKMAEATGAAPVFVDAVKESTINGGPVGGQTIIKFPNDHFSYLVTWFSLSGVTGYLWYLRHLRKFPTLR